MLAHQDDEMAMATRIAYETRAGRAVRCVVLTNGVTTRASETVRDGESLAVLAALGVPSRAVGFLGSRHGIRDGTLAGSLDRALALVELHLGDTTIDQIFCLAWEGGHPDHDASHLVALALARRRRLLDQVWQFPLYHGRGVPGALFRVMAPLYPHRCARRSIGWREGARVARLTLRYRSQRSTWIGLLPEALVKWIVFRRETMQAATTAAVLTRPHEGALFYERRFGVTHESWRALAAPFIERHVAPSSGTVTDVD